MRTLTLIRKTVSPADPPVTLPCPPPKEAKAPSGQGAAQNGPLGRMVSELSGQESPSEPGDFAGQGEFSGQGAGQSGFSGPVPPMPRARGNWPATGWAGRAG